jgi:hypothetical protein
MAYVIYITNSLYDLDPSKRRYWCRVDQGFTAQYTVANGYESWRVLGRPSVFFKSDRRHIQSFDTYLRLLENDPDLTYVTQIVRN